MLFCSIVTFSVASMVGIGTSMQLEEQDWHMCQISNPTIVQYGIVSVRTTDVTFCVHNKACNYLLPMTPPVDGFAACWREAVGPKITLEDAQKELSEKHCYNRVVETNDYNFPYHDVYEQGDLIYFDNDHTDIVPICKLGFERQGESAAVIAANAAAALRKSEEATEQAIKDDFMVKYNKLVEEEEAEREAVKNKKSAPRGTMRTKKNIKVMKAMKTRKNGVPKGKG